VAKVPLAASKRSTVIVLSLIKF